MTNRNLITQAELKEIVSYDQESGLFYWKVARQNNRIKAGSVAGCVDSKGYIVMTLKGRQYKAHRLAWLYIMGMWPKELIDHIDMNRSNNKWSNLREATHSQNKANIKKFSNNTSGVKCVTRYKGKWKVAIMVNGKNVNLGSYDDLEDAKLRYKIAANEYFGQFARVD
jgi:hypothetical protein